MATTTIHDREMTERIYVDGSDFAISMDRHEAKNGDDKVGLSLEREVSLQWFLRGFCVKMEVTKDGRNNEVVKYGLPMRDTVGPEGLANILSLDEKRIMLRSVEELNEWQKENPHLPELGDYVWRIAMDAKLSEVER